MRSKIIAYTIGLFLCLLCAWSFFYILVMSEVIKPSWMKKSKHTVIHKHADYTVRQVIYKWTPMIGDSHIFGYGLNTEEVKEYSK